MVMTRLLTFILVLFLVIRLDAAVSPSVGALMDTNGTLESPLSAKLTVTLDTFSDFETAPRLTNATYVLRGYHTVGGGGGGEFVWDATLTSATNLGTIIKPSDVVLGGRFLRQVIGPLTPEMFGATTGAGTDSTLAIQAAFTAAKVVGDGYLEPANRDVAFLNGRYVISSPITIYNGASIYGAGQGNTIISTTSTNIDLFTFSFDATAGVNNTVSISDMSFLYSNGGASNTAAIRIEGGTCTPTIRNVTITGAYNAIRGGLWIGGVLDKVYVINPVSDGIFIGNQSTTTSLKSCYVRGSTGGSGYFIGGTYNSLESCASDANALYGYHIGPDNGFSPYRIGLRDCGAEVNTIGGVWIQQANAIDIGLYLVTLNAGVNGIYIDGGNDIDIRSLVTTYIGAKGSGASIYMTNVSGLWPYSVRVYGGQMDGYTNRIVGVQPMLVMGRDYSNGSGYGFGRIAENPIDVLSTNITQARFDSNVGVTNAGKMEIFLSPFHAETWLTDQNNTAQTVTYGRSMAGDSVSEDFRIGSITANYPINHLTPFLAAAIGATNTVAINLSPSWVPTNVLLTIDGAHYLARATTPTNVSLENVDDLAGRSVAAVYWTNTALGVWVGGTRYFETFRAYSSDGSARIPGSATIGQYLYVTNFTYHGAPVWIHSQYFPQLLVGTNTPSVSIDSGTNVNYVTWTAQDINDQTNSFAAGFSVPGNSVSSNFTFSTYLKGTGWGEVAHFGAADGLLAFPTTNTAPVDAVNVKRWKSIVVEGTTYRIPLYE